ncbi:MAG: AraC family transcriptional regulator [Clostridia bacterium]|nr:AraC family transcriptional regulator [Clostridia bacterium]
MNTFFYRHNSTEMPGAINEERIPFNELTFVLKGQLNYKINGESCPVKSGDAIYIKSGSLRQRMDLEICDYVSFNFYNDFDCQLPILLSNCINSEMKLLFSVCDKIYSKYYDWFDKIDPILNTIVKLILSNLEYISENPVIAKTKMYIRDNLQSKITLTDLAEKAGYSPNYLDALFKKTTGTSLINYIMRERVDFSKRLIDEGVLSLKEISEAVGIDDYNYFSRIFKKISNQTPSSYRALIHGKNN